MLRPAERILIFVTLGSSPFPMVINLTRDSSNLHTETGLSLLDHPTQHHYKDQIAKIQIFYTWTYSG